MTDTLQPNVLTVNPDGTIGANLTGHLAAQGVDLPAGTNATPPSNSRVRWLSQSDGSVVADIYGYSAPGHGQVAINAYDNRGNIEAALSLSGDGSGGSVLVEEVDPTGRGHVARVLYGAGQSDFLQLNGLGNCGTVPVTFANQAVAGGVVIQHGLGKVPRCILITGRDVPNAMLWAESYARDARQFFVAAQYVAATTGTFLFDWLAIA